jgi:PAS domain S-box-containing protein
MAAAADAAVQSLLVGEAVEGAPAAVFVADDRRCFVAVNRYACELLGHTRDELLELRVDDLVPTRDAEAGFEELRREGLLAGNAELRRKDGGLVKVRFRAGETTVGGIDFWVGVALPD